MGSVLKVHHFGSRSAGVSLDRWEVLCTQTFLADAVRPVDVHAPFNAELRMRWVDDCLMLRFRSDPFVGMFAPGSRAGDYIGFGVFGPPVGELVSFHDGSPMQELTHAIGVWDNGNVADFKMCVPKEQSYLMVPKDALRGSRVGLSPLSTGMVVDDKPTARLLSTLLGTVLNEPAPIARSDEMSIRNAVIDLIAGAARETAALTGGAVNDDMRQRVEQWITTQITDGPVTPTAAAVAHGISLRSLHRLFVGPDGGSFSETVRRLRLESARACLGTTTETVQSIAARWGFSDASHFCREFKRTYKLTTTEFRARCNETPIDTEPVQTDMACVGSEAIHEPRS